MSNAVVCRVVTKEEQDQVEALWRQCFDDAQSFVTWYFSRYYQADNTLGIFAGTFLQASAQMIPYTIRVRDTLLPCAYIVGVNTALEARKKGYAKQLLQECLSKQREKRQPISLLMPFEGQFYYRYGWPFCYFHQQILIKPQELCCAAKRWGEVYPADLFQAMPEMQRIYEQFCQQYHGTVRRTPTNWRLLLEDAALEKTVCFLLKAEDEVQGYCLWTPLQGKCFIREMAWCNERAKNGLLWFFMQNVAADDQLWLELAEDDNLSYQLAVSKTAVIRYPFLMARIVDVLQCLEMLHYPVQQFSLLLAVTDAFAAWNTGLFHLQVTQGKAAVTKLSQKAADNTIADVTITIDALSQLIMGARSARQLQSQEILQVKHQDVLDKLQALWPPQHNYMNEYY